MPRVHHLKARKDYPDAGVKKGEMYYKWTTRAGPYSTGVVHRSTTPPKQWQLTSSPFLQSIYMIQDELAELTIDDLDEGTRDDLAQRVRDLEDEEREKFDNMPEGLQQGDTGQLLEERADACNSWADELEGVEIPEEGADEDERQEALDNLQSTESGL